MAKLLNYMVSNPGGYESTGPLRSSRKAIGGSISIMHPIRGIVTVKQS